MAARAYVLIRTAPGLTKTIYSGLKVNPLAQSVEMITGPYDLIVAMEAESTNDLLLAVMRDIRPSDGVQDTMTCLVVPGEQLG
jgi:hypothetical protein